MPHHCHKCTAVHIYFTHFVTPLGCPSPPRDSMWATTIVWRLKWKIIRTVPHCIAYIRCAQWYTHVSSSYSCICQLAQISFFRLTHLSVKAFCFGCCICRPSVCPTSDLKKYARQAQNFVIFIGNRGRQARIWRQILHWKYLNTPKVTANPKIVCKPIFAPLAMQLVCFCLVYFWC